MKHGAAIKRNGLLIRSTTWMVPGNYAHYKKSTPEVKCCLNPFIQHCWNDKTLEMENKLVVTMVRMVRGHQTATQGPKDPCGVGIVLRFDLVEDTPPQHVTKLLRSKYPYMYSPKCEWLQEVKLRKLHMIAGWHVSILVIILFYSDTRSYHCWKLA